MLRALPDVGWNLLRLPEKTIAVVLDIEEEENSLHGDCLIHTLVSGDGMVVKAPMNRYVSILREGFELVV